MSGGGGANRRRRHRSVQNSASCIGASCAALIEHGRGADTPAALVENGTRANQRVVTGTLTTLPDVAAAAGIRPPALLIVGEVVALADKLAWFNRAQATV